MISTQNPVSLEFENLSLRYERTGPLILNGINLFVEPGEVFVLLGTSGSGKTSLLRIAAGLLRPIPRARPLARWLTAGLVEGRERGLVSGYFRMDGVDVTALAPRERNIGMVTQTWDLLPHLSAQAALLLTLRLAGITGHEAEVRARATLAELGLAGKEKSRPAQLSGGETQRLAIGRLLVRPQLRAVYFDECLGSLDSSTRGQIFRLLRTQLRARNTTAIWVTHSVEEARTLGGRVGVLDGGSIVQDGTLLALEEDPKTLAVYRLMTGQDSDYLISKARLNALLVDSERPGAALVEVASRVADLPDATIAVRPGGWEISDGEGVGSTIVDCIALREDLFELLLTTSGWHGTALSGRPVPRGCPVVALPRRDAIMVFDDRLRRV